VQAATRPAGGSFGTPANLSAPGHDALDPHVAITTGLAIAVWQRFNGTGHTVQAAARPANGVWQRPVDLSATSQDAIEPQVALDPASDAVAVWERVGDPNAVIEAASRPAASGRWQPPFDLSTPRTVRVPDVVEFSKHFAALEVSAADLVPRFTGATTAPNSYVAAETPTPGTLVRRGSTVTMRLLGGPPP